jgi:spermidine synthase
MQLARTGVEVHAVDIDPLAPRIAEVHFGFEPARVATLVRDARTHVSGCAGAYDVIVIDLFHGDGTPQHLVTREFFADVRRCLTEGGIAVLNTFADLSHPAAEAHLHATIAVELPHLARYRPRIKATDFVNSFVVASAAPLRAPAPVTLDALPPHFEAMLWGMLALPSAPARELAAGGLVVRDAMSAAVHDAARTQMNYRRSVVRQMPAPMLLN